MFVTQDEIFVPDSMDHLWLARMCVGERKARLRHDPDEIALLCWAMINRWMLHPGRRRWKNFAHMLRLFSQPINPRWMKGGDLAERNAGKPSCSPARLKRRERLSKLPWSKIPKAVRRDVQRVCEGRLAPPGVIYGILRHRISNWASYPGVDKKFPGGLWYRGNYYFEDRNLKRDQVLVDFW